MSALHHGSDNQREPMVWECVRDPSAIACTADAPTTARRVTAQAISVWRRIAWRRSQLAGRWCKPRSALNRCVTGTSQAVIPRRPTAHPPLEARSLFPRWGERRSRAAEQTQRRGTGNTNRTAQRDRANGQTREQRPETSGTRCGRLSTGAAAAENTAPQQRGTVSRRHRIVSLVPHRLSDSPPRPLRLSPAHASKPPPRCAPRLRCAGCVAVRPLLRPALLGGRLHRPRPMHLHRPDSSRRRDRGRRPQRRRVRGDLRACRWPPPPGMLGGCRRRDGGRTGHAADSAVYAAACRWCVCDEATRRRACASHRNPS